MPDYESRIDKLLAQRRDVAVPTARASLFAGTGPKTVDYVGNLLKIQEAGSVQQSRLANILAGQAGRDVQREGIAQRATQAGLEHSRGVERNRLQRLNLQIEAADLEHRKGNAAATIMTNAVSEARKTWIDEDANAFLAEFFDRAEKSGAKSARDLQRLRMKVESEMPLKRRVSEKERTPFERNIRYMTRELGFTPEEAVSTLKPGQKQSPLTPARAYNTLLEYKAYLDAGQQPSQELVNEARAAAHILKRKQFFRDPQGNLQSYTPGIPEGFPYPAPTEGAEVGTGAEIKTEISKDVAGKIDSAVAHLGVIADTLESAAKAGETITGAEGWAKSKGGGFARQIGIPVSPLASDLERQLNILKALASREIMQESRLSDAERARLDNIIGSVHPSMDDVELRRALADVLDMLLKAK